MLWYKYNKHFHHNNYDYIKKRLNCHMAEKLADEQLERQFNDLEDKWHEAEQDIDNTDNRSYGDGEAF